MAPTTDDEVAEEVAFGGVLAREAELVRVHLDDLADVVERRAGDEQVLIDRGVELCHLLTEPQDGQGMVEEPALHGVVQAHRGRVEEQFFFIFREDRFQKLGKVPVRKPVCQFEDGAVHRLRLVFGGGDVVLRPHIVRGDRGADVADAKLGRAPELLQLSADLDDGVDLEHRGDALLVVPVLGVDVAVPVPKGQVHVLLSFGRSLHFDAFDQREQVVSVVALTNGDILHNLASSGIG